MRAIHIYTVLIVSSISMAFSMDPDYVPDTDVFDDTPIIDRMVLNGARDSEKKTIFYQLMTLINYSPNTDFKHNLVDVVRVGNVYSDPEAIGGTRSVEAVANLVSIRQLAADPQNVLDFLEICVDFLKMEEPEEDSWKMTFFHGAVMYMDKGNHSMEQVRRLLEQGTLKVPEEVLKALGVEKKKKEEEVTVVEGGVTARSPSISDAWSVENLHTANDYIFTRKVLQDGSFFEIFKNDSQKLKFALGILKEFGTGAEGKEHLQYGFKWLFHYNHVYGNDTNYLKTLGRIQNLDFQKIMDLAKEYKSMEHSEVENLKKKMLEFELLHLFKFSSRLDDLTLADLELAMDQKSQVDQKLGNLTFTEKQLDALEYLVQVYHMVSVDRRFLMEAIMTKEFSREECVFTVARAEEHWDKYRVYASVREFDGAFGTVSCLL